MTTLYVVYDTIILFNIFVIILNVIDMFLKKYLNLYSILNVTFQTLFTNTTV